MRRVAATAIVLALAAPLSAQRGKPTFEWQKRTTTIDHGALPLGRHSLEELKVGTPWRLGMNEATTWTTAMPILADDRLLAPGSYRLQLARQAEDQFQLLVNGAQLAVGGTGDVPFAGKLGAIKKSADKLTLAFAAEGAKDGSNQPVKLTIQFGKHEVAAPMTVLGGKSMPVQDGTLVVFAVPAKLVEARATTPVPIATFTPKKAAARMPAAWNLVLDGNGCKFVPWMTAPTEQFGFGPVQEPAGPTATGTCETAAVDGAPVEQLTAKSATMSKGELSLQLSAGKELLTIKIKDPLVRG